MTLRNCKDCGKLFVMQKAEYCSDCQTVNNQQFMKIRDYLKRHPKSTIMEIHTKTGVPVSKILEMRNTEYVPYG
ncbi:MAG: flagellar operon protein [Paenibacillus sp.]|jgi:hypothetical protein|nr:flagellar operon protein [Paenibacillus sp.]